MTDCENGEIRDLLPAFAHDGLGPSERAAVAGHLASCPSCHSEVALIRTVSAALEADTPRVDLDAITRALPTRGLRLVPAAKRTPRASYWMAAAASVLVVGTVSLAGLRGTFGSTTPSVDRFALDSARPSDSVAGALTAASRPGSTDLTVVGGVSDLSNDNLNALLVELETISPTIDAEPASLRRPLVENDGGF